MNLVLFFEGTGQGVEGNITNVTRLRDVCVDDASQKVHLEAGPGTQFGSIIGGQLHGAGWREIFRNARRWFEANYETLPSGEQETPPKTDVFLFGFSRGALIARHFASWLDKLGVEVAYLGLWDTVDSTIGLDVPEECPTNVRRARHAVARDEARRFFGFVPLRDVGGIGGILHRKRKRVMQLVFPGCHSDVGGLYDDNHVLADVSLAWMAQGAKREGLRFKRGVKLTQKFDARLAIRHSSLTLASNLFGAIPAIKRKLHGIKEHISCRLLK